MELDATALLAAFFAYKVVLPLLGGFYAHFLRPGKNLTKYGQWAVVTGATDGIGKALCFEFAKKGLDVFLISRTESKLADVEAELRAKHPKREFRHLAVDYGGGFDSGKQAAVRAALTDLDVGVLANNVGMSYPFTKYYHELTDAECAGLVALNTESTLFMTKIALGDESGGMIARKRGAIVNTSSAAGTQISPLLAGYSAAKGGVVAFSKSLHHELARKGVAVQVQTPLWVTTKLAKIRKATLTVPSPATYAKAAVAAIGYGAESSPFWAHDLQLAVMDLLPTALAVKIASDMHHSIRKRGMKKEAEKKKSG